MATQLAQATSVPASGASNAEDFQPQTRNPQDNVVPTQPQSSNSLQTPTSMDVLSDENLRIIVPGADQSSQSSTLARSTEADSGANFFVIAVVVAVVVLGIGALVSNRRKPVEPSKPVVTPPPPKKKAAAPTPPKKTKSSKKSKSKRKRK